MAACFALIAPNVGAQARAHLQFAFTSFSQAAAYGMVADASGNLYIATNTTVVKQTWSGGIYTQSTILTGLSSPKGVALDSQGNLYIAESGNSRVLKVPWNGSSFGTPTAQVFTTPLVSPSGVAVDSNDNLYIADAYILVSGSYGEVLKETPGDNGWTESVVAKGDSTSSFQAVAVDAGGNNVYVTDTNKHQVLKESWSGSVWSGQAILTDTYYSYGIAVADNGDLYVSELDGNNNGRLLKLAPSGESYTQSTILDFNWRLVSSEGVAIDRENNVFVGDPGHGNFLKLSFSSVDYGAVKVGANAGTSTYLQFKFDAVGTIKLPAILTMGAPNLDFLSAGGDCTSNANSVSYPVGGICAVQVKFSPKQAGARNGAVLLYDAAGNTIATVYIRGTGIGPQAYFTTGGPTGMLAANESVVVSGLSESVRSMAVDGNGNVYVADPDNNQVLKLSGSDYSSTTIGTGLSSPYTVAVDGSGAVYIADHDHLRILKETPSGATYIQTVVADSNTPFGLSYPYALAVDGSGNVYIGDALNYRVVKETPSGNGYTQSLVVSIAGAFDVEVDGEGNVYTIGNNSISKEIPVAGGYTHTSFAISDQTPDDIYVDGAGNIYVSNSSLGLMWIETPYKTPSGTIGYHESGFLHHPSVWPRVVASDNTGNFYVLDSAKQQVLKEALATPPARNFATTEAGSPSPSNPLEVKVWNLGNDTLTFPLPDAGTNPSVPANFAWNEASGCHQTNESSTDAFTLPAGGNCSIDIDFVPASGGNFNGNVVLTDNNLNVSPSTQSIAVSGTATGSSKQPQSIAFTFSGPVGLGASPTLTATATSGLQVTFASTTSGVCTTSPSSVSGGVTTATLQTLSIGTCTITADQVGDATYSAAATVSQTFSVVAGVPTAPTIDTAKAGNGNAVVKFGAPWSNGGATIIGYTVTSSPGGITATGASSPIVVSGLTNGTAYTFTVAATNSLGTGPSSQASNSVTPLGALDFGSVQVGGSSSVVTLTFVLNFSGNLAVPSVLTMGAPNLDFTDTEDGTCTTQTITHTYSLGDTCTVTVKFSPKQAGTRLGAVVLQQYGGGAPIATTYLSGKGTGPQVGFSPEKKTVIASGLNNPYHAALDGSGNFYIADSGAGTVVKVPPGGSAADFITGLLAPSGIAVDGAGNIYIAEIGAGDVLKRTPYSTALSIVVSGLQHPRGLTVDSAGNLYIADMDNSRVLKETFTGNHYTQSVVADSGSSFGLTRPTGVAVDEAGNVYISDQTGQNADRVLKETLQSETYVQSVIRELPANGVQWPEQIALDASGTLFVAVEVSGTVIKETPNGSGGYIHSTISGFGGPRGVVLDGQGNIYVTDAGVDQKNASKVDAVTPPILSFADTTVGSQSVAQTVNLWNYGNSTLTLTKPTTGTNPSVSANFQWNSASTCQQTNAGSSAPFTLAPGSTCTISVKFAPAEAGTVSGGVVLTDDDLNASPSTTQTLPLTGNGLAQKQSQTITFNSPGTQKLGTSPTITATASSGLQVTFGTSTSSVCIPGASGLSGGVTSATLQIVATGPCTVFADQAGDDTYNAASRVTRSFTIITVPDAPTIGTATMNAGQATVTFTPPASNGGDTITGYTATSDQDGKTGTGTSSPIHVSGLTQGKFYVFTVTATNSAGTGPASAASNSVIWLYDQIITFDNPGPQNLGTSPALTASADSHMPVTFTSATTGICTIASGDYNPVTNKTTALLTTVAPGQCTIDANQSGNSGYNSAKVSQTFFIIGPPGPPTAVTAVAGDTLARVSFTAPASNGGAAISYYTVTPSAGDVTATGTSSPITITGLKNDTSYTFTVTATNSAGLTGPSSDASNQVTPKLAYIPDFGSIKVGASSSIITETLTVSFPGTIALPAVLTMGAPNLDFTDAGTGTCTTNGTSHVYKAGDTCTVDVQFSPKQAGTRKGAVVLFWNSQPMVTYYIHGIGEAPQITYSPAAQSVLASGVIEELALNGTTGVAVDGSGNVYIADSGNYRVLKETWSGTSYTESVFMSGTVADFVPTGIAMDGEGSLYVADAVNNFVWKYATAKDGQLIGTVVADGTNNGLSGPSAVAVDSAGNVYVSDTSKNRVLKETLISGGRYTQSIAVGSEISEPHGIAVDSVGNIFFTTGNPATDVIKATPQKEGSYSPAKLTQGATQPNGLAVDGIDNLYITDTGNHSVFKETLQPGGGYAESVIAASGAPYSLQLPSAVALDGRGNVYIADLNKVLKEDLADPPSLNFGSVAAGGTSTPLSIDVINNGNEALTAVSPGLAVAGSTNTSDFQQVTPPDTTDCTTTFSLASGAACKLRIQFTPAANATGSISGTATLTDNNLNASPSATQSIALSGTIPGKSSQTITFVFTGPVSFGASQLLSASSTSGLTVVFSSATTSVCTITSAGALTTVSAGSCTIDANQSGNGNYDAAPTVSQQFTINAVAPYAPTIGTATAGNARATVTFTGPSFTGGAPVSYYTVTPSSGTAVTGSTSPIVVTNLTNGVSYTFTVTATNSANLTGPPSAQSNAVTPSAKASQTITFNNPGAKNFGTSPVLKATSSSGMDVTFSSMTPAVCTISSFGKLTTVSAGACTICADQAGNATYAAAPEVSQTFTINAVVPGAPKIGQAVAGNTQATVSFTAPASTGGVSIISYTVTSNSGGFTATGAASPITVAGLTNGVPYRFTVAATNSVGTGAASGLSNAVTPKASQTITFDSPGPINFGVQPSLSATATSGLTVRFTSSTANVCRITAGGSLTTISAGTCTINADQPGSAAYLAASRVSQSFSIGAPNVVVSPASLANPTLNTSYSATITASGGNAPYNFTVISGTLPPSLSLNKSGLLSGKATRAGKYTFTIKAVDSTPKPGPYTGTQTYTVTVN